MKKWIQIFFLLIPLMSSGQILARIDINEVQEVVQYKKWTITGEIYDPTGSYNVKDVIKGNRIVMRGIDRNGKVVFDRFIIDSVLSTALTTLTANIVSDFSDSLVLNVSGSPLTGSFPLCSSINKSNVINKPSFYQTQFDPDYDAGIDNMNLSEIVGIKKYECDITADGATVFDLPREARPSSVIFYNGKPLGLDQWSGSGSSTITIKLNTKAFDHLLIIF